jgi:hypothetical protein
MRGETVGDAHKTNNLAEILTSATGPKRSKDFARPLDSFQIGKPVSSPCSTRRLCQHAGSNCGQESSSQLPTRRPVIAGTLESDLPKDLQNAPSYSGALERAIRACGRSRDAADRSQAPAGDVGCRERKIRMIENVGSSRSDSHVGAFHAYNILR